MNSLPIFTFQDQDVSAHFAEIREYERLQVNLAKPPGFTTLRCNTLKLSPEEILDEVKFELPKIHGDVEFDATMHPVVTDLIVIPNHGPVQRTPVEKEVIVDRFCGMAVLRGADVYASGLLAMSPDIFAGDKVSLYVDITSVCLRGSLPPYQFSKMHIGNGIAKYSRSDVFCGTKFLTGLGIEMTEPLYVSPKLNNFLPDLVFAQNLPSCLCAHVLDPQPGETILDMCAAPGGKTCHIGSLMNNTGTLIALDKAKKKMDTLKGNLLRSGCTNTQAYCYDGSKAVTDAINSDTTTATIGCPPYPPATFDRILLDAPCSALGQRPSLSNPITSRELSSYPILQRKLLASAVRLLKVGGVLVYSTCTFTRAENEGQISQLLQDYPDMNLESQGVFHLNKSVDNHILYPDSKLTDDQLQLLQTFHPAYLPSVLDGSAPHLDTIGFFIAKLRKCDPV